MNAILGAKDDPRYLTGGIGEVRGQLEAEQDQRQGHLHLNHGKLLPDAIPHSSSKRQKGVRVPARYILWRKTQRVKHQRILPHRGISVNEINAYCSDSAFWQGATIMEGDGLAELPGYTRHWGVEAKALLDAHGAVGHLPQVFPLNGVPTTQDVLDLLPAPCLVLRV